jgi:Peptidase family M1 domain
MASLVGRLVAFLSLLAGLAAAQESDSARLKVALTRSSAERFEPVFQELRQLAPRGDAVASVHNLTLRRDAIQFHLLEGQVYLLTSVAGRTVGAAFVGRGSVALAPPIDVERVQLRHVLGDSVLEGGISAAAFLFADSTLVELQRQLTFSSGPVVHEASGVTQDAVDRLLDGRTRQVAPAFMDPLLNGDANGFFFGYVKRDRGEDVMVEVDPLQAEQIMLLRAGRNGHKTRTVCQFRRAEELADSLSVVSEQRDHLKLDGYRIETTIGKNLDFSASATIRFTARQEGVRWIPFLLFDELKVDSVVDGAGDQEAFFRGDRSPDLWIQLRETLRKGQTDSIRVAYHGDLITYGSLIDSLFAQLLHRWADTMPRRRADSLRARLRARLPPIKDQWFFVKESETWFPRYGYRGYDASQPADMDLTFHLPVKYRLASVGRLVASTVDGDVQTTRWVTDRPVAWVSFNIGEFTELTVTDPRIPPVTLQTNSEGHLRLDQLLLAPRDPEKDVSGDVANSLAFFTHVFGPPLFPRYYATEIPYPRGQAFPGLIYLSVWTFESVNVSGVEESFRAHEMAHQWWGVGVEPASYRDAWLSEGFADFAGLWYMQLVLNDNEKYFKQLKDWRREIRSRRDDALPTGLGVRVAENDYQAYQVMIYRKGAWVLQMLRNLMLDFRTMSEDAFTAMMQDFYQQYRGRRASTRDFQAVVEKHLDVPMDWFFDEWVNGTAIPTYVFSWHAQPAGDHGYVAKIRVRQEDVPPDFFMPVPLRIELADGTHAYLRVNVRGPLTEGEFRLPAEPKQMELNPLESVLADVKTEGWN